MLNIYLPKIGGHDVYWSGMLYHFIVTGLIVLLVISLTFFIIRRLRLNPMGKYSIIVASTIFVLFTVIRSFGYDFFIIFSFIEWTTKFVFPWIVLYWLIRAIKTLEKRG